MKIRLLLIVVILMLLMGGFVPMSAGTIVGRLPGTVGLNSWALYSGQFLVSSWTQGDAFNESISAYLNGTGDFGFQLTTAVGPTATASEIVTSKIMTLGQGSYDWLQVFSGLTLPANTYYLTVYGIGDAAGSWPELVNPTVVGSLGGEFYANDGRQNPSDPYRSAMLGQVLSMGILVQGDASAVPEPSSMVFVATALTGLILSLRRRVR